MRDDTGCWPGREDPAVPQVLAGWVGKASPSPGNPTLWGAWGRGQNFAVATALSSLALCEALVPSPFPAFSSTENISKHLIGKDGAASLLWEDDWQLPEPMACMKRVGLPGCS